MVASSVIDLSSLALLDLHESSQLHCHDINMDSLDPTRSISIGLSFIQVNPIQLLDSMWQVMVDWCCMAPHKVTTDPLPGSLNLRLVKAKEEFQLNYFYKFCTETSSSVSSVAFCPYDEPFMLLGSEDGSIRLHSTNNDRWKKIFLLTILKALLLKALDNLGWHCG